MALMRHQRAPQRSELFDPVDRLLSEWFRASPLRWPGSDTSVDEHVIQVDEFQEGENMVIRAELPDVDPDKDVEISMAEGMLHIKAKREQRSESKERDYVRRELRYGSFQRTLPLPTGVSEDDVKATYDNGVLEIRVPLPKAEAPERKKIAISKH